MCPDGVDVVLDSQGGEECNRGYTLLKPLGRYILFGIVLNYLLLSCSGHYERTDHLFVEKAEIRKAIEQVNCFVNNLSLRDCIIHSIYSTPSI